MLGRDGKSKGERLNDSLISFRQRYLSYVAKYRAAEDERFRVERLRDKAEQDFLCALRDFDSYYGEKK